MATVSFSPAGEVLYAYLAGEIDHDAAQSLRIQLDDALVSRTPQTMILDFGGVGFMDSSGVGLILGRQRIARTLGTALRVQVVLWIKRMTLVVLVLVALLLPMQVQFKSLRLPQAELL